MTSPIETQTPPPGPAATGTTPSSAPTGPIVRVRKFGRSGHAYYLGNEKLSGVTTVIKNGVPSPALIGWAARTVAEYVADHFEQLQQLDGRNAIVGLLSAVPNDQRDTAAVRGTDVHHLAKLLHAGGDVDVPDHLEGHVDAYIRFLEDWNPTDELTERVVVNRRWRYAGRLDMICRLADGQRWLIDWKTSRSGVFAESALQLAAYRHAEHMLDEDAGEEVPMPQVDATGVVWVTPDSYQFYPVTAGRDQFDTFLYAMQVARFAGKDGTGKKLIGAALEPGLPM